MGNAVLLPNISNVKPRKTIRPIREIRGE